MNQGKSFTEEDVTKIVKFNNFIAKHAKFTVDTAELVEYYKLLGWFQSTLTTKVKDHIFEVISVDQGEKE